MRGIFYNSILKYLKQRAVPNFPHAVGCCRLTFPKEQNIISMPFGLLYPNEAASRTNLFRLLLNDDKNVLSLAVLKYVGTVTSYNYLNFSQVYCNNGIQ